MRLLSMAVLSTALACGACNSPQTVVPEPNKITLQDALVSTVDALNAAYAEARKPGNQVIGYYPCTMAATFNVSATGVTDNKLGGSAGGGVAGVTLSANASHEDSLTGTRGNNVTVVFASSICAPSATAKAAAAPSTAADSTPRTPGRVSAGPATPVVTGPMLPAPKPLFSAPLTIEGLGKQPER